jgi:serine/threonine protein phosphatase 1
MTREKIFIIGDVHGCLDMLERLMDKIDCSPEKDTLIFLGDYIDRGDDSKGVVDYILDLRRDAFKVEALKGNHEAMFLNFLRGVESEIFIVNGGWRTMESYGSYNLQDDLSLIPSDHRKFYASLKLYIELDDYYIVHAGFNPGVEISKQTENDMLWIRRKFISSNFNFGKKVIFGHTPFQEPLIMKNKIGLDTGAVFGNKLTCLELPGEIIHSVEA